MRRSIIHIWWKYQNHFEDLLHHNHPLLQLIARVLLIVQWPDSFLCRTHFQASTASLPPSLPSSTWRQILCSDDDDDDGDGDGDDDIGGDGADAEGAHHHHHHEWRFWKIFVRLYV